MLKRIALMAIVVVSGAFAGVGVAKAHSGATKAKKAEKTTKSSTIEIAPPAPKGFCFPPKTYC
jgi:hypothetical protein